MGARGIWGVAASTLSTMAQQLTEGPRAPMESRLNDRGRVPRLGMRSAVGLNPVTPQKAAGIRTDPPVSVPMPAADMPSATDTPAPEEEPPGRRPWARAHGARGGP